jgi:hypothetical protein
MENHGCKIDLNVFDRNVLESYVFDTRKYEVFRDYMLLYCLRVIKLYSVILNEYEVYAFCIELFYMRPTQAYIVLE